MRLYSRRAEHWIVSYFDKRAGWELAALGASRDSIAHTHTHTRNVFDAKLPSGLVDSSADIAK